MINVAYLAKNIINMTTPYQSVILKICDGELNDFGVIKPNYSFYEMEANIQSTNKKNL